jgi:ATP-dependent Clp protease ATP-binding subunit ClpA
VDDEAYLHFLRHAQSELFGAREIRRVVDSDLRRPLAEHLLAGPSGAGTIRVVAGRGGIEILRT